MGKVKAGCGPELVGTPKRSLEGLGRPARRCISCGGYVPWLDSDLTRWRVEELCDCPLESRT